MAGFVPRRIQPETAALLARELGIHPVTAQVLAGRGHTDPEEARRFLRAGNEMLRDPQLLPDMEQATALLARAIHEKKLIAIYGDYDVDGVCSTAILAQLLPALGGVVRPFIPHRVSDGYGLNEAALLRLADEGCAVVVTVDNGTSRAAEVAAAQARGMEVVVTDHHEPSGVLPRCPVVNPKRTDQGYPFAGLAGCGVAYKFGLALAQRMGMLETEPVRALLADLTALVAIGTVADVVPLIDENRALVAFGLRALNATRHPGLRALLEVAQCSRRPVRTLDIGYRIGPRLNAAGRLDSAHLALDLLMCTDPREAAELARKLDAGNRERQRIERSHAEEAFAQAGDAILDPKAPALVLAGEKWHPGVIGIVAARVAESFRKPTVMITIDGDSARGSARSFGGVRLHEALDVCAEHLLTHGGHAFAAGFTMRSERVEAFRGAFQRAVASQEKGDPGPTEVDAELPIDAINSSLAAEIESLAPFGAGNEEPVFCAWRVRSAGRPQRMGQEEKHLSFYAASARNSVRAVAFNKAAFEPLLKLPFDLSFNLRTKEGGEGIEIFVREIVASA